MDCDEKILKTSLAVQFFSSSFRSTGFHLHQSRVDVGVLFKLIDVGSRRSSQVNLTASPEASSFPRLRLDIVDFEEPLFGQLTIRPQVQIPLVFFASCVQFL